MFERFTPAARDVVTGARDQARLLRSPTVGTEHLLLALLEPGSGLAARVLREAGLDPERVRRDVERRAGQGPSVLTDEDRAALQDLGIDVPTVLARLEQSLGPDALTPPPSPRGRWARLRRCHPDRGTSRFSPRAKKVLELSLREALALRSRHIGAEHVLLGLLREGRGLAAQVLTQDAGVGLDQLRRATLSALHRAA